MQGTEHDIALFLALGCAIALHCIALYCSVLYCIALHSNKKKKRRNARPFLVLRLRFSHPKPLKNKAGCWPFFAYLRRQNQPFFLRFWCHFPSRGHPWSLPGRSFLQMGLRIGFFVIFKSPGKDLGLLLGPFGSLGATLGSTLPTLGPTLPPKVGIKDGKRTSLVHIAFPRRF